MNLNYPYNRLQELKQKRLHNRLFRFGYLIVALVAVMVIYKPDYALASGEQANPSNVPYLIVDGEINTAALPETIYGVDCGLNLCTNFIIWNAGAQNSGGTRQTCVATTHLSTGTGSFQTGWESDGAGNFEMDLLLSTFKYHHCWQSGIGWVAGGFISGDSPLVADVDQVFLTTKPLYSNIQIVGATNIDAGYGIGGDIAKWGEVITDNADTDYIPLPNATLTALTGPNYVTGMPIRFEILWEDVGFDVWWTELYKDPNQPQYHESLDGHTFNLLDTNEFVFTTAYVNSGTYVPSVLLGNGACTSASSTGTLLRGTGCEYVVVTLSGSLRLYTPEEIINLGSGSTVFSWVGPETVTQYYGSGSAFEPTGTGDETVFSWVAGTGSLYYQQITETGSTGVGLIGAGGIFNSSLFNFAGFGTSGNIWLDTAQSLLLVVVYAGIWVAQFMYQLLQLTSFFDFFISTIHPPAGTVAVVPTTLWGFPNPAFGGTSFTVTYAPNSGNYQNVTKLIQLAFVFTIIMYVFNHFVFFRKHK